MIKEIVEASYAQHVSSGKFSVSGIAGCKREKYFALWKKYKKTWESKDFRVFDLGDYVHRKCVANFITNAPSLGFEVIAAEINLPVHEYLSGRVDCILSQVSTGEKTVVDFKSCGTWTFNKLVRQGQVSEGYIDQVNMYMHLLGIHKGYLLFVCKDNSKVEEFEVVYDKSRALQRLAEIEDFFVNYVHKGIIPPKCDGGDFGCDICGLKKNSSGEMISFVSKGSFDIMDAQGEIQDYLTKLGGSYKDLYKDG